MKIDAPSNFWSRIKKTENNCWEWTMSRTNGYGQLTIKRKRYIAHRLSWTLTNGEIPKGLLVCHKCDNPPCINPDHLFLGTHKDNNNDAQLKGRSKTPFVAKDFCKRGHRFENKSIRKNREPCNVCLKCRNIARDIVRRKLNKKERTKRNQ